MVSGQGKIVSRVQWRTTPSLSLFPTLTPNSAWRSYLANHPTYLLARHGVGTTETVEHIDLLGLCAQHHTTCHSRYTAQCHTTQCIMYNRTVNSGTNTHTQEGKTNRQQRRCNKDRGCNNKTTTERHEQRDINRETRPMTENTHRDNRTYTGSYPETDKES